MSHNPTPTGNGPWRLLILDRDPTDPKLILATVAARGDVESAAPGTGPAAMGEAQTWVRGQLGRPHAILTPMTRADVWWIDESPEIHNGGRTTL